MAIDSLLDNLLADYAPYRTPDWRGDLEAARAEMWLSRYDRTATGAATTASAPCKRVRHLAPSFLPPDFARVLGLDELGMTERLVQLDQEEYFPAALDPTRHFALVELTFGKTVPTASDSFLTLFHSRSIADEGAGLNVSLLGATPNSSRSGATR